MKKIHLFLLSITAITGLLFAPLALSTTVSAASADESQCKGLGGTWNGTNCDVGAKNNNLPGFFKVIIDVLLFLIGAVGVLMLIIGGIKYMTSGGDSAQVTSAKNTILYAIIGIVVALMGYAIVYFVVDSLAAKPTP